MVEATIDSKIIEDVAKHLPFAAELDLTTDDQFYNPLINYINISLGVLNQNGVGSILGVNNPAKDMTWKDFMNRGASGAFDQSLATQSAKSFTYLNVQLLFDTPQSSTAAILEKSRDEYLWRARMELERYEV